MSEQGPYGGYGYPPPEGPPQPPPSGSPWKLTLGAKIALGVTVTLCLLIAIGIVFPADDDPSTTAGRSAYGECLETHEPGDREECGDLLTPARDDEPTTTDALPETTTTTAEPIDLMEPLTFDGVGNDVVDVLKPPNTAALATITANDAGRYCGITSYDSAGGEVALLVNTTDPYSGTVPVDLLDGDVTARLNVECEGPWHIEMRDIGTAEVVTAGAPRQGAGDFVYLLDGASTATIQGNASSRYFSVQVIDLDTGSVELPVNTTDPYVGEVMMPASVVLVVTAVGDWTITGNP